MYYKGLNQIGEYCGRITGHGSYLYHSPWTSIIMGVIGLAIVIALTVIIIKAVGKKNNSSNDELLELLKSKYVSGEIDEEEYLRKKKMLTK